MKVADDYMEPAIDALLEIAQRENPYQNKDMLRVEACDFLLANVDPDDPRWDTVFAIVERFASGKTPTETGVRIRALKLVITHAISEIANLKGA